MEFQFHLWPQWRYPGIEDIAEVTKAGEKAGFTAAASGEHVLVPNSPDADMIGDRYYDPMVLFSYLASCTTRIRLQFCAMVVPHRHPGLAARGIASIDQLSHGRFELVLGSGWSRTEFDALGLPFDSRAAMTDEYIEAMRRLWTEDEAEYHGRFVDFGPTVFEPKCVQKPHVPLWIGGTGKNPTRRVAEYGAGWQPMVGDLNAIRDGIEEIRDATNAAGRDAEELGFTYSMRYLDVDPYSDQVSEIGHGDAPRDAAGSSAEALEIIGEYADAGLTRIMVACRWDEGPHEYIEKLQQFGEEVIAVLDRP